MGIRARVSKRAFLVLHRSEAQSSAVAKGRWWLASWVRLEWLRIMLEVLLADATGDVHIIDEHYNCIPSSLLPD